MNKYLKGTIAVSAAWFCLSAPAMAQWTPPSIPQPAQAASSWGFLSCAAPGQRQEMGAAIGAVAGGVIGNRVGGEDNQLLGTAVGAAVGGLAGSWIGCRLQTGDQRRAQEAAQRALAENNTQTWSNPETGASGQVRVMYGSGQTLSNVSFMPGVQVEPRYEQLVGDYEVLTTANLRAGPTAASQRLGQLTRGERVSIIAKAVDRPWYLVARNGQAIGYVSANLVSLRSGQNMSASASSASSCRVVEEVIRTSSEVSTAGYRACPTAEGGWSLARI